MKNLIILFSFITPLSFAETLFYKQNDSLISKEFKYEPYNKTLIKMNGDKNSIAYKCLSKINKSSITPYVDALRPSSDVCLKLLKGSSVLGYNEIKNSVAFCLFKDGSIIELNSLENYIYKIKKAP